MTFRQIRKLPVLAMLVLALAAAAAAQTGGVKGKVRTNDGRGIGGATVTARQDGKDLKTVTANSDGDFILKGLEAGEYNLVFEADGYASGVLFKVEVKRGKINDLGNRLRLGRDQGSLVIVKGSIFYREGTSLGGASVELSRVDADGNVRKLASGMTNISGEFTFRQPQGEAKLRVTAKYHGVTASKDIDVSEPAIYRLAITLDISRGDK